MRVQKSLIIQISIVNFQTFLHVFCINGVEPFDYIAFRSIFLLLMPHLTVVSLQNAYLLKTFQTFFSIFRRLHCFQRVTRNHVHTSYDEHTSLSDNVSSFANCESVCLINYFANSSAHYVPFFPPPSTRPVVYTCIQHESNHKLLVCLQSKYCRELNNCSNSLIQSLVHLLWNFLHTFRCLCITRGAVSEFKQITDVILIVRITMYDEMPLKIQIFEQFGNKPKIQSSIRGFDQHLRYHYNIYNEKLHLISTM